MKVRQKRPLRTRIRFRVEVRGSRQSFDAEAQDVSVEGLCLWSPILMAIGDRAGASLRFQGGSETSLSFEVRWARAEGANGYRMGVEFVHTAETRRAMQKVMWEIESGALRGDEPAGPPTMPGRSF